MSEQSNPTDATQADPEATRAKAPWHPPTLEEVDYSATEFTGAGGVYDFTLYSGST
jgi:hypothetical protein